ncbi:MAG: CPBP family intramembrane metalloprotease [Firmicutes bacterium]|nr:CPBP family intramembrane metalloprotease [Bacillota bacterium]
MTTAFQKKVLRPYGKWSDILPLAWVLTAVLVWGGQWAADRLLEAFGGPLLDSWAGSHDAGVFLGMYGSFLGIWILITAVMLFYGPDRPMLKAIGHNRFGNTLKMGVLGLLVGFSLNGLCILLSILLGDIRLAFQGMGLLPFASFLIAVLIQSGAEELAVRCFLYQKLRRRYRHPAAAILGSALFFTVLHLFNPGASVSAMLEVTVSGLLFSLIIYYYGSFWGVCGIHAGWNFTQSILFGLPNSGLVSAASLFRLDAASAVNGPFYSVGFGVEGSIGSLVLESIFCVVVIIAGRRSGRREDLWREAAKAHETV